MSPPNGKTNGSTANDETIHATGAIVTSMNSRWQFTADEIQRIVSSLEVPFDPSVVEWRVTNTSKGGKPRGMVIPYANQRAYTDRLNELFSPAGWTRRYTVHTSANFQQEKDQKTKMVAKVFVTCELTIFGIGHIQQLARSGLMTTMPALRRKPRLSSGLPLVLDLAVIFTTSRACG